jgi:hypothetical protein
MVDVHLFGIYLGPSGAELGAFIGSTTADDIKAFFGSTDSCPMYTELFEQSSDFRQFINDYMLAHQRAFPTEHDELVAMSTSAGVLPAVSFIQNGCAELSLMLGDSFDTSKPPVLLFDPPIYAPYLSVSMGDDRHSDRPHREHCSDLGLLSTPVGTFFGGVLPVQGHNEDWWSTVADKMSILTTPGWMGYLYPGQLAGTSMVVNCYGLSLTMNSMYPSTPGYTSQSVPSGKGISYLFSYVLRGAVKFSTTKAVLEHLSKYPIYSGYSLNVLSSCDGSVTNVEGYGDKLGVFTHQGADEIGSVVGHYNSYSTLAVKDGAGTSSERAKCQARSTFNSSDDIRSFLGNLTCPMFFTSINGARTSETLATWIMNPETKTCTRYRLPADCDIKQSKCFGASSEYTEPQVYDWKYECPTN